MTLPRTRLDGCKVFCENVSLRIVCHASFSHGEAQVQLWGRRRGEVVLMAGITPDTYLAFMIVNAVVWPGFSLAYWYLVQREEESLMEAMSDTADARTGPAEG